MISDNVAERGKAGCCWPSLSCEGHGWSGSPYINQFLSADTLVPGISNPQNLNRYSYVTNNPLRYTDPTGHMMAEDKDGGLGVKGYKYVIENKFKWHLKGEWSQEEVNSIYRTGNDILAYADGVTGGNGLDWMHGALGNTTIIHGENNGEHSETWPTLFGPKIWLGKGWLNDGGWDSKELLAHELGHVWDINSGFSASGEMNKDLGGSSWCFFCAPGDDVPQWNPDVHYSNGDAYGNSGRNEYFAEAFSQTVYGGNTPMGVSQWIGVQMLIDVTRYLFPRGIQ